MKAPDKKYPLSIVGDLLASMPPNEIVFMPDKIYVHKGVHLGMLTLTTIPVDAPGEEIYIRKDALMELLKPERDISFPDDYERGCIDGRNGLRGELIDKLNSM